MKKTLYTIYVKGELQPYQVIERIVEADISYIEDWFNDKNELKWEDIRRKL